MVAFNSFFSPVLVAVLYSSTLVNAAPWPTSKHATHRVRTIGRDLKVETYHPKSTYTTYGSGKDTSGAASFKAESFESSAVSFIASELGVNTSSVGYRSGHSVDNMSYSYAKQYHDGVPFANAVANAAFKNGKAVAFGSSFVDTSNVAPSIPSIALDGSLISKVEDTLLGTHNGVTSLEYLAQSDGSVALTHVIQVQNNDTNAWYEAFVDAHSGEILSVTDFVAQATFTVIPIIKDAVTEGEETLVDPEDLASSPSGWVQDNQTAGNNVIAYKSSQSATTSQSSNTTFDYPYDITLGPTNGSNIDAARTNAFYIINKVHDYAYKYGWTETSYNFQADNFGKGGAQGDRVLMGVQDSSGTNNANFATPPDGQSGTCRMYIWTLTTPQRDGALQNDIIVHEFTHGITNRLTGGGTGRCLQTTEAGGMGEGWSDAMAEWTEHKDSSVPDYVLATWVFNNTAGIRTHPYSTDASVNPLRYSSIQNLHEVHDIGEVWANMLHNVYAALVQAHGFSSTAMDDPSGPEGNIVWLHLFIDALSLQPCNPMLPNARDAWIQADQNRYDGANKCILWNAFASRGLGMNATNYVDDASVPSGC
ncbi:Fungalysin metallopeptidase-domain-containing protein [Desarmillaria tabescens]|uniref:Extracellular metalloproteinase n=1 Tax=Armillaria tabescens TaxID=1929756 RepID=A0AA39TKH6_ARMTA|nr:Fungalysin metallopeptidase-domain-containing protein [Desarmillaria tabescens]KAK0462282.1 Fungalysin metallopeptidase-domain-containing protein [Desarmillaria tabescens]